MPSPTISLRVSPDLHAKIVAGANAERVSISDYCNRLLMSGIDARANTHGVTLLDVLERLEVLELRLNKMEEKAIPKAEIVTQKVSAPAMSTKVRKNSREVKTVAGSVYAGVTDLKESDLLHPKVCSEMLGLKYPSGWEGLCHRHGTDFERNGYRFTRTESKKGKAFLWLVEKVDGLG